ncbi:MarR family transcriptional regulator [Thermosipho sp. 1063]|uniref:winged helix-turn-helix transcriptional regulator n=1 Tax=unclassified Thermosipho (in: thermotogales) TaxID=2676525 RepID=UPI000949228B|nr:MULTISPECIES: winged helix-turn-helix transcriptional regulator [unclassified Thermosipho (in: thermotogales)]ANQ54310.1 MarR family transcriptional regulator [Thermosipho sp. 1070]APT72755.1 MarR family transcriptional regulator [Thermosipho sp. 1063]
MVKIDALKFFQPTPEYRKLLILESINKDSEISQKNLSSLVGIVPSLVNKYLNELRERGLIKVENLGKKLRYFLTEEGISELYYLKLAFFNDIVSLSMKIESHLENIFLKLKSKNFIGIYGAGLVGKTLAQLLLNRGFNVVVFFDDNTQKIGNRYFGIPVISIKDKAEIDAIIVASIKNSEVMVRKAKKYQHSDIYVFNTEEFKIKWHG